MGAQRGFTVLVSGALGAIAFLAWTLGPLLGLHDRADTLFGRETTDLLAALRERTPDVYFALAVPLFVSVALLAGIILYALFSLASMPEPQDFKTIVDTQGARQKRRYGDNWVDLHRDTPFVNDLSALQVARLLHRASPVQS
ncbi:Phosphatidylinositol N-acetylglucosaminyltransferase subunit P [Hondaea fermentalgiana]|uniref:Phosphatidylinositol N-acetylglucosaminyltransferase subunit P n=1 Tax=Hondaea fermentalgiana TaxID=2315210 RepID=A0A2R5GM59_9STRA|nr:Phosphatidylinositol N-acetylglucosaminyltransferase subunit P [Hondaea fermentalgiana]|eukprot:GBG31982.1 Phosphatidylinositol N-acetylglucosaminyltransferase subunit P [Hondaea fermentalgiana]